MTQVLLLSKKKLVDGVVGSTRIVKTTSRDFPPPPISYLKTSGGIFRDCACHDIDMCRWLLKEDPVEVFVCASAFNPEIAEIKDFDTVVINFKTASGKLAIIDLSRVSSYGYDQRIEVLGAEGMLQAMNVLPTSNIISTSDGLTQNTLKSPFTLRYKEAYACEIDHYVDLVVGKIDTPRHGHQDSRKIQIICDACDECVRTGKPVQIKY